LVNNAFVTKNGNVTTITKLVSLKENGDAKLVFLRVIDTGMERSLRQIETVYTKVFLSSVGNRGNRKYSGTVLEFP
jgi:hypothetical protein